MSRRAGAAALVLSLLSVLVVRGVGPASGAAQLELSPASGPAGSEITVNGAGFAAGVVEVHWSSQSGPLLGARSGPDFSLAVVVPDAAANSYPVVAVLRGANGVSTSSAAFQVTPRPVTEITLSPIEKGRDPVSSPPDRGSGVGGGLDPAVTDTGGGQSPPATAVTTPTVASSVPAPAAAPTAGDPSTTAVAAAAGAGASGVADPSAAGAPGARQGLSQAEAEVAGGAFGPASPASSSGGVQPLGVVLVAAGLGLAGAALVTVRHRRGAGS